MPLIGFLILPWVLCELLWWWWADRRVRRFKGAWLWRVLLIAFILAQIAYITSIWIATIYLEIPRFWPMWAHAMGYLWHVLVLPVALMSEATWRVGRFIVRRTRGLRKPRTDTTTGESKPTSEPAASSLTRRQVLLGAAAVATPPLISAIITGRSVFQLRDVRVRKLDLPLASLPPGLDGVTISHLTDLHIGKFLPDDVPSKVADLVNSLKSDLIVFTGDIIDVGVKADLPAGLDFLRRLDPGHGLALIEGNHDIMADPKWFTPAMVEAGMPILNDEAMRVQIPGRPPIEWLGVSWGLWAPGSYWGKTGKYAERWYYAYDADDTARRIKLLARKRSPDAFPILLAHHPHSLDPAAEAGLPLVLSGHTHGGQVMLTDDIGAGPLRFKYWRGTYQKGPSALSIANGIGQWFPLRVNAPPEVVQITLRKRDTLT